MPKEVATEMLATPGLRMTRRERRAYQDARQREFSSELTKKPMTAKLQEKVRSRSIKWLGREAKRTARQRRGLQVKYEAAKREEQNPVIARLIALLDLKAAGLDAVLDAIQDEIQYRLNLTRGITEPHGAALLCPELGLTRGWVSGTDWIFRRTEFPRWVSYRVACLPTEA